MGNKKNKRITVAIIIGEACKRDGMLKNTRNFLPKDLSQLETVIVAIFWTYQVAILWIGLE